MVSSRLFRLSVSLAGLVLVCGASAQAQTISPVQLIGPERVTVKAEGVALGDLLDQLAVVFPLNSLKVDPAVRSLPVSLVAEGVSPLDAMWLALKASGVDFVMSSTRVRAGRAEKAVESPVLASAARPNRETPAEAPPAVAPPAPVNEHLLPQQVIDVSPPQAPSVVERTADFNMVVELPLELVTDSSKGTAPPPDQFGREVGAKSVPFFLREDSVVVTQPGFVPYKLRTEVKNRRMLAILGDIP